MSLPVNRPVAVPATRFPQQDATVAGDRIRFVDVGEGPGETVVIIPGHTARLDGFDTLVERLGRDRRVLVFDYPGSGYSDKPERRYDLRFYEDTTVAFLDTLGVDTAVPVGGSLGGNLVLRLGHRFPDRFRRLALWAPGGAWKARPHVAKLIRVGCGTRLFWPTVRVQSRYWYEQGWPGRRAALDETFAYYREVMCPGFVNMYWGMAADQVAHSLFDIAADIPQPTLLCWGDRDHGANMGEGVARLHAMLPNGELCVFVGARHSLEAEIPYALAERIAAFLAKTEVC